MAKTDGKLASVKPVDNVKPADNVKSADVKKPRKGSQNSLSLSPRWTLHVTRPFNLYKEGQGSPKREEGEGNNLRARHKEESRFTATPS